MSKIWNSLERHLNAKAQESDRDETYFHPSEFGDCPVKIWYKISGIKPDEHHGAQDTRVFDNGHFLHLRYQLYMRDAGLVATDKIVSIKIESVDIGTKHKDIVMVTGTSGRVYPFDPREQVWMVTEPDPTRRRIAGMEEPVCREGADLKVGDEIYMVEVPLLDKEYHFGGHADLIALDDDVETVVDFKSKSEFTFAKMWYDYEDRGLYETGKMDPHFACCHICGATMKGCKELVPHLLEKHEEWTKVDHTHKVQLHIYMWLLNLQKGLLLHENKSRQVVHCQEVLRDDDLIEKIQKRAKTLWRFVEEEKKPPIPSEYKGRTKFPCGWCDFAARCWS